jgi:hypothetical protein
MADGVRVISNTSQAFADVAADRPGGVVAAAGTREWEDRESSELWLESPTATHCLEFDGQIISIDLSPGGSAASVFQWADGGACVWLIDTSTGKRRLLTALDRTTEGVAGNEPVRFSPDGVWLLIATGSRNQPMRFVNVATGDVLTATHIECEGVSWWPSRSPSSLLTWRYDEAGNTILSEFDIAKNDVAVIGCVAVPDGLEQQPMRRIAIDVAVGSDGEVLLCRTAFGPAVAHQMENGSCYRLATGQLVAPSDGVATSLVEISPPFPYGTTALEVEDSIVRWTGRSEIAPEITLDPTLFDSSRGPISPS